MNNNNLLRSDIQDCSIENIKDLVEKVVVRYIGNSVIPYREKYDVVMTILEKFIHNRQKIDDGFEGKSKITTYYIAVFNRMCCEVIRKESKHWYAVNDLESESKVELKRNTLTDADKKVAIVDELKQLANVMNFFKGQGAKVNLFMKYYFRIPLDYKDIFEYSAVHSNEIGREVARHAPKNNADIFNILARIINIAEGKEIKGDAVRMWLNKKIEIILTRINMNGTSKHTRESLQILMEMRKS